MPKRPPLTTLADDLENGRTNSRKLVDECLARISDQSGEGGRVFVHVDVEAAIEAAKAMDRLRDVTGAPCARAGPGGSRPRESRCARGGEAAPGRLHRDRPHQYDRIRFFRDWHQPA